MARCPGPVNARMGAWLRLTAAPDKLPQMLPHIAKNGRGMWPKCGRGGMGEGGYSPMVYDNEPKIQGRGGCRSNQNQRAYRGLRC
jgi:hypothetical protein